MPLLFAAANETGIHRCELPCGILKPMADLLEYKEKPGACAECGNSPVNHTLTYAFNLLNVPFNHIAFARMDSRFLRSLEYWARLLMDHLERVNVRVFEKFGGLKYGTDVAKARTYRSQVIWEEANRRGIRMEQVILFGVATDIYRAHVRGYWIFFKSLPVPPELPQSAYLWIDDKFLLKNELEKIGVAAPAARSVTSLAQARRALADIGAPVVLKPRAGSRGRHTTTMVSTDDDLVRAFRSAQRLCRYVAMEKCLSGPVCRATVVGGKLAGFFAAFPPTIVGDGVSTVSQLIEKSNASVPERVQPIALSDEHLAFIKREGYSLDSILEAGTSLPLSHRTGRLFGGSTRELLDSVHPKLRAVAERAAQVLDVPVVGFDLIIPDPEADPDLQQWGIIEANSLPFIDLHYLPLYGTPSNPAAQVWDLWK